MSWMSNDLVVFAVTFLLCIAAILNAIHMIDNLKRLGRSRELHDAQLKRVLKVLRKDDNE